MVAKKKESNKKTLEHVPSKEEAAEIQKDIKKTNVKSYILMFTIEGHKTWRLNPVPSKEAWDKYLAGQLKHPKLTEMKWFVVDRITGNITAE